MKSREKGSVFFKIIAGQWRHSKPSLGKELASRPSHPDETSRQGFTYGVGEGVSMQSLYLFTSIQTFPQNVVAGYLTSQNCHNSEAAPKVLRLCLKKGSIPTGSQSGSPT